MMVQVFIAFAHSSCALRNPYRRLPVVAMGVDPGGLFANGCRSPAGVDAAGCCYRRSGIARPPGAPNTHGWPGGPSLRPPANLSPQRGFYLLLTVCGQRFVRDLTDF